MKVLGAGLAVSVLVHGALLGLGRLNFGSRGPAEGSLSVVTLPPEAEPAELDASLADLSTTGFALVELASPAAGPELSDYPFVLERAMTAPLSAPLVPRPRTEPLMVESGLTPIRVPVQTVLTMGGRGSRGNGIDGLDVTILMPAGIGHGGDSCVPRRFVNYRRSPVVSPGFRLRRW
jgi:hypothetical protein